MNASNNTSAIACIHKLGGISIMKKVLGTMVAFYVLMIYLGAVVTQFRIGYSDSDFSTIYIGLTILSGIIVICTNIILEKLNELKDMIKGKNILEKKEEDTFDKE